MIGRSGGIVRCRLPNKWLKVMSRSHKLNREVCSDHLHEFLLCHPNHSRRRATIMVRSQAETKHCLIYLFQRAAIVVAVAADPDRWRSYYSIFARHRLKTFAGSLIRNIEPAFHKIVGRLISQ